MLVLNHSQNGCSTEPNVHCCHCAGLFRGFAVTLARDTPSYGLYFLTYHWMVAGLNYALQELQPALNLSRDALAAAAHHQPAAAFADSWNSSSSSSIDGSSIDSPAVGSEQHSNSSVANGSSEAHVQQQQQQRGGSSELLVHFVAGGVAGAVAWMSVYPLDVVKSRMQVSCVALLFICFFPLTDLLAASTAGVVCC
jgi:hypothetical protein